MDAEILLHCQVFLAENALLIRCKEIARESIELLSIDFAYKAHAQ